MLGLLPKSCTFLIHDNTGAQTWEYSKSGLFWVLYMYNRHRNTKKESAKPFSLCLVAKAYLIYPTNSLTFPNTGKCSAIKTDFHKFCELILPYFCFSCSKMAIIPSISTVKKHVKFLEISLETMMWGNLYVNVADFGMKSEKCPRIC